MFTHKFFSIFYLRLNMVFFWALCPFPISKYMHKKLVDRSVLTIVSEEHGKAEEACKETIRFLLVSYLVSIEGYH